MREYKEYFNLVEEVICKCLSLDKETFKSKYRGREYVEARSILFYITYTLSSSEVGLKTVGDLHRKGYDHSSVIHQLNNYNNFYGVDLPFTNKALRVMEVLEELEKQDVKGLINA